MSVEKNQLIVSLQNVWPKPFKEDFLNSSIFAQAGGDLRKKFKNKM